MTNWKDKTVLVTGGSGFIGTHLINRLKKLNANVINMDIIPSVLDVPTTIMDIRDINSNFFDNLELEYVVHLAAVSSPRECEKDPVNAFNVNVYSTFALLQYLKDVEKIVIPSSIILYPNNLEKIPIPEVHPIDIYSSCYAFTKGFIEQICNYYIKRFNTPIVLLRFSNNYGPYQSKEYLIPTLIMEALEFGRVEIWSSKPIRDFIYVGDTVDAIISALQSDYIGGPINIGTGKGESVKRVAEIIEKYLDVEIVFLEKEVSGPMKVICDVTKAEKLLSWKAKVNLEEGLEKTIECMQQLTDKLYFSY